MVLCDGFECCQSSRDGAARLCLGESVLEDSRAPFNVLFDLLVHALKQLPGGRSENYFVGQSVAEAWPASIAFVPAYFRPVVHAQEECHFNLREA